MLAILATAGLALRNSALVFVKPHAATDACEAFVRQHLAAAGVSVFECVVRGVRVGHA